MEGTPPGDALPPPPRRATPARKGTRCGASAGSPRPHRPHPGHPGRGTLTARSRRRTAGEGQRLTPRAPHNGGRHPPGEALPPPPQRATPARKGARCGAGAGSTRPHRPHPGHTGRGPLAARSRGRAAGGGTAPDTRRPSQRWKASPPGTPFRQPHSEQRRPARAHAVGPVLGPHARIDRTRDTRVAEPWPPGGRATRRGTAPNTRRPSQRWNAPLGMPIHHPHTEQRTSAPTHQPRDIRTPPRALRHSGTAMAEPAAPRKTRPRSPTLDEAHEVIRALGLRDGEGDPRQGDAGTDSDLEALPEPPTGGAPAEPAPPAGSVLTRSRGGPATGRCGDTHK